MPAGATVSNVAIIGVILKTLISINTDAAGVTGLTLGSSAAPIVIKTPAGVLMASTATSTGSALFSISGIQRAQTYSGQSGLVLGQGCPPIFRSHTVPNPVAGSYTTCNGVDPTGGSATQGGLYLGNSTSWTLQGYLYDNPLVYLTDKRGPQGDQWDHLRNQEWSALARCTTRWSNAAQAAGTGIHIGSVLATAA